MLFNINRPSLLPARRKRLRWGEREGGLYQRHRRRVEGVHGEAKTWHGLARAMRPGLDNMRIQAFLIAAAALKQIYKTKDADAGQFALEDFAEDGWSKKYSAVGPSWRQNWPEVIPFFAFPDDVRRIICTAMRSKA